ncbi:cupin domain-containing protein [Wukongibacter baidiensis]|uniref:cupin domain-containing protein n=1 Tax=Wukongibacter baidiensis TaxID=1723361 RepID=UPI003D7FB5FC
MKIISEKDMASDIFKGYEMLEVFVDFKENDCIVKMGKAVIKSGARIPEDGFGVHDAEELSYIIKGSLKSATKQDKTTVKAGDFSYIPAGEEHWCQNISNEDCELIWFLLKKE